MTCDNCKCDQDPMGICQHARARLQKRESKKNAAQVWTSRVEIQDVQETIEEAIADNQKELDKLENTTFVSAHTLSEEEFVRMVSNAYFRFKPTMDRLK